MRRLWAAEGELMVLQQLKPSSSTDAVMKKRSEYKSATKVHHVYISKYAPEEAMLHKQSARLRQLRGHAIGAIEALNTLMGGGDGPKPAA